MACSAGSSPATVIVSIDGVGSASSVGRHNNSVGGARGIEFQNAATAITAMNPALVTSADDIIKMGILRKGRKGKKRFFVLHQETYGKPARLDCYDSEKQFCKQRSSTGVNGPQPKLSIQMKTCFNINKRADGKLKHCIAVYTMEDALLLGCENEQEQEIWLQTLLTVLRNTKGGFGQDDSGRLNYEHVWDVNILRDRGLTEKNPSLSGHYRLCMTHSAIFLYRKGEEVHSLEFPLVFIASYGCKGSMWFLRVGRTAMTGSGELTMETEDPIIAANINETMKSILEEHRQRSTSISERRSGMTLSARSSIASASVLSSSSSVAASSTSLERSGSFGLHPQSRARAISESEKTLQSLQNHLIHPRPSVFPVNLTDRNSSAGLSTNRYSGRGSAHSPSSLHGHFPWTSQGHSSLGTSHSFCSNESVGSISCASDHDHSLSRYFPRQTGTDRASSTEVVGIAIAEESSGSGAEYLPMQATLAAERGSGSSRASSTNTILMRQRSSNIPPQQQQQQQQESGNDVIMDMDATRNPRRMTAPSNESEYLEMARANAARNIANSNSSDHVTKFPGYTPMGPSSTGRPYLSSHSRQTSWNLEEVRSYISDSDVSSGSVPPSRAWSVGSRPTTATDTAGTNCSTYAAMGPSITGRPGSHSMGPMTRFGLFLTGRLNAGPGSADDRKRAHSVGSWNKPPWKRSVIVTTTAPSDAIGAMAIRTAAGGDQNMPSTSSFCRQRSESFGSARSTPGNRRLLDGSGSKLSNQSEDLVEVDFGRASIGRSPSGSLGSSDSITRSRASSTGAAGSNANAGTASVGWSNTLYGRQPWSPRVEQITEQELMLNNSPSGKLIQLFQQQLSSNNSGKAKEEYVPMGPAKVSKENDYYCAMGPISGSDGGPGPTAMITPSVTADDYLEMSLKTKDGGRVFRQHSSTSATSSCDPVEPNVKHPIRHSSGSSNLSLGNLNCMGLDSGVGGSSFSLDHAHLSKEVDQQHGLLRVGRAKGRSLTSLAPMDEVKERLARVELASATVATGDTEDGNYVQMLSPSPVSKTTVRRSSSLAKTAFPHGQNDCPLELSSLKASSTAAIAPSPSLSRSPFLKMFASFGKGSTKTQRPLAMVSKNAVVNANQCGSTVDMDGKNESDELEQLEYAALDIQQDGISGGPAKTANRCALSSSSSGGDQTPKVIPDGVVYAKIDAARTSATVESKGKRRKR